MKQQERSTKNIYNLIWSDEAIDGLQNIFNYLELNFSTKDVKKYTLKLEKSLDLIRETPNIFPVSPKSNNLWRCVLAKLTSIYFIIEKDTVKLVSIIDNRRKYLIK